MTWPQRPSGEGGEEEGRPWKSGPQKSDMSSRKCLHLGQTELQPAPGPGPALGSRVGRGKPLIYQRSRYLGAGGEERPLPTACGDRPRPWPSFPLFQEHAEARAAKGRQVPTSELLAHLCSKGGV